MEQIDYGIIFKHQEILSKLDPKKDEDVVSIKNFLNNNFPNLSNKQQDRFLNKIIDWDKYKNSHENCCEDCKYRVDEDSFDRLFDIIRTQHEFYPRMLEICRRENELKIENKKN